MLTQLNGGYDEGYRAVKGFWGTEPGSLVADFLRTRSASELTVLDVGAGEGKNAAAFAASGARIDALECSSYAIDNGQSLFPYQNINWIQADATDFEYANNYYDVVVCYGLIHCLARQTDAERLIRSLQDSLRERGTFILVSFNDGSHDFSEHPGFEPLLLSHDWIIRQFDGWHLNANSNSLLFEIHPHNRIPHHHSMSRVSAVKP